MYVSVYVCMYVCIKKALYLLSRVKLALRSKKERKKKSVLLLSKSRENTT